MTSLTRSALVSVFCSRCWRCSRTLTTPSSARIATMPPSKRIFSLALRVGVRRHQHRRVGSVSGMLHDRLSLRYFAFRYGGQLVHDLLFFSGEDGQVFHGESEEGEARCDDAAGDRQLGPLGEVANPGGSFESGDADVHAVGDKAEYDRHSREVQTRGTVSHFG